MPKFSRDKGKRGEREVVKLFTSRGHFAKRISPLEANAVDKGDVLAELFLPGVQNSPHLVHLERACYQVVFEVKRRAKIATYLTPKNEDYGVFVREDGGEWLLVLRAKDWIRGLRAGLLP